MYKSIFSSFSLLLLAACSPGNKEANAAGDAAADTSAVKPNSEVMCFVMTEGDNNQDTTRITLSILLDNKVAGTMDWMPYEKDGAYGVIEGEKKGDIITGIYRYTIEGSEQSEEVAFKLSGNQLLQKEGELMEKTPGQADLVFKDAASAQFTKRFDRVECK
jgi:hypothetical protein